MMVISQERLMNSHLSCSMLCEKDNDIRVKKAFERNLSSFSQQLSVYRFKLNENAYQSKLKNFIDGM